MSRGTGEAVCATTASPRGDERAPLAQVIYIAEDVLERAGLAGRAWTVPDGHIDDPDVQAANRALSAFASEVYLAAGGRTPTMWDGSPVPEGFLPVRVVASEYLSVEHGPGVRASAQPVTNSITVRHQTNDLTVLHEVAHLLHGTCESGDAHDDAFALTVRDLYAHYLSVKAAERFWTLVGLRAGR